MEPSESAVVLPVGDCDLGMEPGAEAVVVETVVALAGVERLDLLVVPWGSGCDEGQPDLVSSPSQRSRRGRTRGRDRSLGTRGGLRTMGESVQSRWRTVDIQNVF